MNSMVNKLQYFYYGARLFYQKEVENVSFTSLFGEKLEEI